MDPRRPRRSRGPSWTGPPPGPPRRRWWWRCCCPTACPTAPWPTRPGVSALGPLPAGDYVVSGVLDQNDNHVADSREAFDSVRLARGRTDAGELWAFVHDTTPPHIRTVTVGDSVSATIELSEPIDPRTRLVPGPAVVALLPDSSRVPVVSLLPKSVDDSLHAAAAAKPDTLRPDSLGADTLQADTTRGPGRGVGVRGRTACRTSRSPAGRRWRIAWSSGSHARGRPGEVRGHPARAPERHRGDRRRRGNPGRSRAPGARQRGDRRLAARSPRLVGQAEDRPRASPRPPSGKAAEAVRADVAVSDRRRTLPSVDRLLQRSRRRGSPGAAAPRGAVVDAVRESLAAARTRRAGPPDNWGAEVRERWPRGAGRASGPVLNATGVVLHTNLGRAPLAPAALPRSAAVAAGYSNLEFDLHAGTRGSRHDHCRDLLREVTGAEDALAVNNAAGALVLALNAHAAGREVLISRGELIEIGGSFRIPDILAQERRAAARGRDHQPHPSGGLSRARWMPGVGAILTVHRSNFEQRGFVTSPGAGRAGRLAAEAGVPYLFDVGSGLLADLTPWGLTSEPRVAEVSPPAPTWCSSAATSCSAGPRRDAWWDGRRGGRPLPAQSAGPGAPGGQDDAGRPRGHARAVPGPRAGRARDPRPRGCSRWIRPSCARRARELAALCPPALRPTTTPGVSAVGGGAFPTAALPTTLVALDPGSLGADGLALRLRLGDPAAGGPGGRAAGSCSTRARSSPAASPAVAAARGRGPACVTAGRAVFLDRDGTIIEDVGYLRDPEQVRLLPGAAEAIEPAERRRAAGRGGHQPVRHRPRPARRGGLRRHRAPGRRLLARAGGPARRAVLLPPPSRAQRSVRVPQARARCSTGRRPSEFGIDLPAELVGGRPAARCLAGDGLRRPGHPGADRAGGEPLLRGDRPRRRRICGCGFD